MQSTTSKTNDGGITSPRKRVGSPRKPASKLNKMKSTEYEKKGTNSLEVENEHLRTIIEKMKLERNVADSRLKDVELLQGQLERSELIRKEQENLLRE